MATSNGNLETLDRMIAEVGDRIETVEYKTIADRYGKEYALWLLRQGYATRKSWRKSNTAAEGRRKAQKSDADKFAKVREAFSKLSAGEQKVMLANHPELVVILGIQQ